MLGPRLTLPVVGRVIGFALVAAAIAATAVHVGKGSDAAGLELAAPADPLAAVLARCQAMGVAAQGDGPCEAAWAESRRRFFAGGPRPSAQPLSAKAR